MDNDDKQPRHHQDIKDYLKISSITENKWWQNKKIIIVHKTKRICTIYWGKIVTKNYHHNKWVSNKETKIIKLGKIIKYINKIKYHQQIYRFA